MRLIALAALLFSNMAAQAEQMRLAVTTSFNNSGLSDVLLPVVLQETGIEVQLLVVGTGQALRLGAAGDVDAVLVHSKPAELDFVAQGHALKRTEIMYNDFVLIGPSDDPANIATAPSAAEALAQIAKANALFVSRGDDSGTHKAELARWAAAGLQADPKSTWYRALGAGMGASLNTAQALGAYILSDRASWLNFGNQGDLALLFSGDPALFNQYSYLAVNPAKGDHIKEDAAKELEAWLTSDRAAELINGYRLEGQQLFTFNAKATNGQ